MTHVMVKIEGDIPISFPVGFGAVKVGTEVLDYLYQEELTDYQRSGYGRMVSFLTGGGSRAFDYGAWQALRIRFLSRMISCVSAVCTIDGVLRTSYRAFIKSLIEMGFKGLVPCDNGKSLVAQRDDEIKRYRFYRNKVVAHTSYADPRGDSASLQHSSLAYFSLTVGCVKKTYLALGGGALLIDGEVDAPELSIVGDRTQLVQHYLEWDRMFTGILRSIPRTDLVTALRSITLAAKRPRHSETQ